MPVAAPTQIYDQHIPELAFYLSESERASFNAIHNSLDLVRQQHRELAEIRVKFVNGDIPGFGRYTQLLHASYSNLCWLVCYADFHIHFGRRIDINRLAPSDAQRLEKDTQERMVRLINEGKAAGISAVRENYFRQETPVQPTITGQQLIAASLE